MTDEISGGPYPKRDINWTSAAGSWKPVTRSQEAVDRTHPGFTVVCDNCGQREKVAGE